MARHRVGSDPRGDVEPFHFWRDFRHDLRWFGLLAVGSLGIGLIINTLRAHPAALRYASPDARLGEAVARLPQINPSASTPTGWPAIGLDEFQELVLAHEAVAVDARPEAFYRAGHVPGAFSLPREDFERGYAGVHVPLEANRAQPIVVYCAGADCKDSALVAGALSRLGFRHLRVYQGGWEEWLRAGLPQETMGHAP